jgi:hypothetical protein
MIEPSRHVALRPVPLDAGAAAEAIAEIVADAFDRFGGDQFWPAHPLDDGMKDGHSSIYFGAAGCSSQFQRLCGPRRGQPPPAGLTPETLKPL